MRAILPEVHVVRVSGGASCWLTGPEWLDTRVLAEAAPRRGILIEPGIRALGALMCERASEAGASLRGAVASD